MASVNNATGVYATLGYSFNDPNGDIEILSTDAQTQRLFLARDLVDAHAVL